MPKKKTTAEFIVDARKVHGDKYDYSKSVYQGSDTKICVICLEHGEFWPTPNNYLRGSGCPQCVGRTVTKERFIEKARKVHGDKYDYSIIEYVNSTTLVKIICPKHGEFLQKPTLHLCGNGCSECSGNVRLTTDRFVRLAQGIYGDKYDYSKSEVTGNNKTKLRVICRTHGEFWISPNAHLRGVECPSCYGTPKKTTEQFILEARKKHGDKYDYSKVDYQGVANKICIICPEHGEFWQNAGVHLRGYGCPICGGSKRLTTEEFIEKANKVHSNKSICGGSKRLTTEEFIEKANKVHSNKYTYEKANYINIGTKVCITCPEHGDFWRVPKNHLLGAGCPKCAGKYYDLEIFIEKARKGHGDKYDYSKAEYKGSSTKLCIICPEHGEFWQKAGVHLRGYGCPICGGSKKLTTEEFVEKANKVHNNKYTYSKTNYINTGTKVCITCPVHGDFWQVPNNHLFGAGCPKCAGKYNDREFFIERSKKVHENKYDYSKVEYVATDEKVCIICPQHGEFWQTPSGHMHGQGCPMCNQSHLERDVMRLLRSQKIKFVAQKTFNWLIGTRTMRLDFFLPDYGVAIECQGGQHFFAVDYYGGVNGLQSTQERDAQKKELCEEHGIRVLYYSDLGIVYPYFVFENLGQLLEAIMERGKVDASRWIDPELPLDFQS